MHEVPARYPRGFGATRSFAGDIGVGTGAQIARVNWGFVEHFPLSLKNDTSAGNERGIDFVIKFVAKEEPYWARLKR